MFLNAILVLGGLGFIFGASLALAEKKFAVQEDPRKEQIMKILPGANCGACGFAGCEGYADAIVAGTVDINQCPVGKAKVAAQIAEIISKGPLPKQENGRNEISCCTDINTLTKDKKL